jgi:hypothetical protein
MVSPFEASEVLGPARRFFELAFAGEVAAELVFPERSRA